VSHKKPNINPRIYLHIWHAIHEEWFALLSLLRFQWPSVLLFFAGIAIIIYIIKPYPSMHLKLASGQPNSSLEVLAKKYVTQFKENGVELELVTTAGAFENVNLLKAGKVDAALSLGGIINNGESSDLISLGSVEYQPFWMLYRGTEYDDSNPTKFFENKKFSINLPGSGTRNLTEKILSMHGITIEQNKNFVSMSSAESVNSLLSKKIDGIFLVAGIESQTIQKLVTNSDIRIFDFSVAEAYTKRLKFLDVLNLPRGSFDLARDIPHKNTHLVGTTTTILIKKSLHPAIQHLFLSSSRKIDQAGQAFFSRPGGFPAYIERTVPASAVAERYYAKGPPTLESYAPFWVASFFDQIWFIIFAILAISYPFFQILPNYRTTYARLCIIDCFDELTKIDIEMVDLSTLESLKNKLKQFDLIENKINKLWIPGGLRDDFFNLKNAVEIVRLKTERLKENFQYKLNEENH
jgi:uncharacterized protein